MINYSDEAKIKALEMKYFSNLGPEVTCRELLSYGLLCRESGDMSGALSNYKKVLPVAVKNGLLDIQAITINNIAGVYFYQGEPEKARSFIEKYVDSLSEDTYPETLGILYSALGTACVSCKLWEKALQSFEAVTNIAKKTSDIYLEAKALHGIGNVYYDQNKLIIAQEKYQRALNIRRRIDDPILLANTINQLGMIAVNLGKLKEAEAHNREALQLRVSANDVRGMAESFGNLSIITQETGGNPRISLSYIIRAARLIERIRSKIGTGDTSRIAFMNQVDNNFRQAIKLACSNKNPLSAFWAFQHLQNRNLLDSLARLPISCPPNVPKEIYRREQRLLQQLLTSRENQYQISETFALLDNLYYEEIKKYDPEYVRLRTGAPLKLLELEKILENDEKGSGYIEVVEWEGTFYGVSAGGINNNKIDAFSSSMPQSMRKETPMILDNIGFHKTHVENALNKFLSDFVLGHGSLFIVPHGKTAMAPLHILEIDGTPLIEHKMVRYLPQAALLRNRKKTDNIINLSSVSIIGDPCCDLKEANSEARQVSKILSINPILGKEATKENVLTSIANVDIIHFSGHAFFDKNDYSRSGIILSDGVLNANDLLRVNLSASLAVINACESGVQGIGLGSELYGFVRSLLLAGVQYIICTLWRVDDNAARIFGEALYVGLVHNKLGPVAAAHKAQLMLIKEYRNDPSKWAPFIFVG